MGISQKMNFCFTNVVSGIMASTVVQILIPGRCEYVSLHGKGRLHRGKDVNINVKDLEIRRLSR